MSSNHPNRSRHNRGAYANPKPAEIRQARESKGLSVEQAAAIVLVQPRSWEAYDAGRLRLHPGLWRLFVREIRDPNGITAPIPDDDEPRGSTPGSPGFRGTC